MSKKEPKADRRAAAREARLEAQRKRQRARRRRQFITWGVVGLAVALIAGFIVYRQVISKNAFENARVAAGCTEIEEIDQQSREHIQQGQEHEPYNSNPPTSGPHLGNTAEWGTYPDPVEPELLVHNLEHGGVVIHYKDLSDSQIEELEAQVESYSDGVILTPNPDIEDTIAFTSWQHLMTCPRFSSDLVEGFIELRCGKGPEKVPLGC